VVGAFSSTAMKWFMAAVQGCWKIMQTDAQLCSGGKRGVRSATVQGSKQPRYKQHGCSAVCASPVDCRLHGQGVSCCTGCLHLPVSVGPPTAICNSGNNLCNCCLVYLP
jgi:hypothetical protein